MSSKKAVLAVGFILLIASLACSNPITDYFSTQTAVMQTATATMWTPTPTNTPTITPTPTSTFTPTVTPSPTKDPRRYYETKGRVNFSYIPPDGWRKYKLSGTNMQAWSGPGSTQLAFFDMDYDGSAADAADLGKKELKAGISNYKELGSGELDLESGADNAWFAFSGSTQGVNLIVTCYFFSDGNGEVVYAMYFRLPSSGSGEDSTIEESMSTFRFEE
jgi:hypothetical protein